MPSHHASVPSPTTTFRVGFAGAPDPATGAALVIDAPWLGGASAEELFDDVVPLPPSQDARLFQSGGLLLGHAQETFVPRELSARTESLYRRVIAACGKRHLYRVWNYVPQINALTQGFENYRAFCQGRAQAFESVHGGAFERRLPAASAVGSHGDRIEVLFVAGETPPHHVENPEQIAAYHYPLEHGPRPPSFARATLARDGERRITFISGTSAIKGHQTIAPGALEAQLECTLDNLHLISRATGLDNDLAAGRHARRCFKVYLRHGHDLAATRKRLEGSLLLPTDTVTYLQAEICRGSLNVEIEATIFE